MVWKDKVLVNTTGGDTYTAVDAARLLSDLGLHQQSIVLPVVSELIQPLLPIKVAPFPFTPALGAAVH